MTKEAVHDFAREVFGDPGKAHSWMDTPNRVFNGMRPKDYVDFGNSGDLHVVADELTRIEHGVH